MGGTPLKVASSEECAGAGARALSGYSVCVLWGNLLPHPYESAHCSARYRGAASRQREAGRLAEVLARLLPDDPVRVE